MPQKEIWEKEYQNPQLITNSDEPQLDFKHFIKWLKKTKRVDLNGLRVLDLGSGTGKNSLYLADRGCIVSGIELSKTAVEIAKDRAMSRKIVADFAIGDIGTELPFKENEFNIILDVVSSNSLNEKERNIYITEMKRVLKPNGYAYVKALCKDSDKHAQNLIRIAPGKEKDTYVMPGTGITERVFTEEAIIKLYSDFQILHHEKKSSYTIFNGKPYRRQFWIMYLQKLSNKIL